MTYQNLINQVFPICQMLLAVFAAIVYAFDADWRHTLYWLAAAVITACVTF